VQSSWLAKAHRPVLCKLFDAGYSIPRFSYSVTAELPSKLYLGSLTKPTNWVIHAALADVAAQWLMTHPVIQQWCGCFFSGSMASLHFQWRI
ncbi:unnamed protein product, partial [Prorocentrum cordatum]